MNLFSYFHPKIIKTTKFQQLLNTRNQFNQIIEFKKVFIIKSPVLQKWRIGPFLGEMNFTNYALCWYFSKLHKTFFFQMIFVLHFWSNAIWKIPKALSMLNKWVTWCMLPLIVNLPIAMLTTLIEYYLKCENRNHRLRKPWCHKSPLPIYKRNDIQIYQPV